MKKLIALATALVLAFGASATTVTTLYAEGSATDKVEEAVIIGSDGKEVALTITKISDPATKPVVEATEEILDVIDVKAPEGETGPWTITFKSAAFNSSLKGHFKHQLSDGSWETIAATFGEGTMTGVFTSLSPVAFVVESVTPTATPSATPSTGDTAPIAFAAIAFVAAAAVCVFAVKKIRA